MSERFQKCSKCGVVVLDLETGQGYRCDCQKKDAIKELMPEAVGEAFYSNEKRFYKNMTHWDPPALRGDDEFSNRFMKATKARLLLKLYKFAFEKGSLYERVAARDSLFMRGPVHSGRGLVVASIKMEGVTRDISVSPAELNEFPMLKAKLTEAEIYSIEGDASRRLLGEKFVKPLIVVMENIEPEPQIIGYGQYQKTRRWRYAHSLDNYIARRAKPGCLVATSSSFVGQISDTMGDGLFGALDKAWLLLTFSLAEVTAIKDAARTRWAFLESTFPAADGAKKKTQVQQNDDALKLEEAVAFCSAMRGLSCEGVTPTVPHGYAHVLRQFDALKTDAPTKYNDKIRAARNAILGECKELSGKMTQTEMDEASEILGHAMSDDLEKTYAEATEMQARMGTFR